MNYNFPRYKFLIVLFFTCSLFESAIAQMPKLGAIRWDAWTGSSNSVGLQVERTLSPAQFHYRVPFFGIEVNASTVTIDGTTQTVMDQEIDYASYAGLDYWAFLWYASSSGLDEARQLYKTSSKKSMIDYCLIIEENRFVNEISINNVVAEFADPSYVRVMGNRPLLYFFGYSSIQVKDIDTLRARSIRAGYGNPYLVQLRMDGNLNVLSDLNMDAFSMYAVSWLTGGVSYQDLVTTEIGQWNYIGISSNKKFVPHVTTGWDKRTRNLNNVSWESDPGPNSWVQMPTPTELSNHVQNAINWVQANPLPAEANTVLIYAWNEHDEGGWLCPTLSNYGGTERIDNLRQKLGLVTGAGKSKVIGHNISAFPNPATDIIHLNLGQNSEWTISTMQGEILMNGIGSECNISNLEKGIYFLKSAEGILKLVKM